MIRIKEKYTENYIKILLKTFQPKEIFVGGYSENHPLYYNIQYNDEGEVIKYSIKNTSENLSGDFMREFRGGNRNFKYFKTYECDDLNNIFTKLFEETAHGDSEHMLWLYKKYYEFQVTHFEEMKEDVIDRINSVFK